MIFTQAEFFIFFLLVYVGYRLIRNYDWQKNWLLAASCYFYAYCDWRFLSLMILCIAVNYLCACRVEKHAEDRTRAKLWLAAAVITSLAVLGVFKYYGFFVNSLRRLPVLKDWNFGTLHILLPLGISFYIFQCLSFSIDVYRRKCPVPGGRDFALYVAFFPKLVAGPIVRPGRFLTQLRSPRQITAIDTWLGIEQFVFGAFKKVFIADRLGYFVDEIFGSPQLYSGWTLWLALVAYTLQIFCDFSGYSDMAIGSARMLGFHLDRNFNSPYISLSITEFWRRWHISLSRWLRDYLYISLGGNRRGRVRTYLNVMVTMLLGGLWHGASWNFVFWGAWHGFWQVVYKIFETPRRVVSGALWQPLYKLAAWAVTFVLVMIGWLFFKETSFSLAWLFAGRMFSLARGISWCEPFVVGCIAAMAIHHVAIYFNWGRRLRRPRPGSIYYWWLIATMVMLSVIFKPVDFQPFIYFQF